MDKAVSKWAFSGLALVFALIAVGLYFSGSAAPTAAAFVGAGCGGGPPPTGAWTISGGECLCADENVTVNGDLLVDTADFRMSNCTVRINSSYTGQYRVFVGGSDINFTMDDNSLITYGDNVSANFGFSIINDPSFYTVVVINNSEIRGAGFPSAPLSNTGVYIYDAANVTMINSTISGGYNGVVLNSTNVNLINASTVSGNANFGILVHRSNFTNITGNTIRDNGNFGVMINASTNVSVLANDIINNSKGGIHANRSTNLTMNNNYVYLNGGNGISNNLATNPVTYAIWNNVILNNSGWAVWANDTATTASIKGNTMCFNTNTTYWALNNVPYAGGAGNVMYNIFCVNVSRPVKGGCTNSDEVRFYVSGNPLSWVSGGETNCTFNIDNVYRNHTQTPGAYHTVRLTFNGTEVGDGRHNISIHCDPYLNVADTESDYNRDTEGPGYSSGGSGGPCENVTLAVYWTDGTCNVSYATLSTNETGHQKIYTNGTYGSPKMIEWNESWSNFSWWNETVKNQYINWLVWANDSAGNWNHTDNATFQAIPCTSSVVTGGGGGGGGGTAQPSACTASGGNMTIAPAEEGQTVSCYLNTDFRLFNFTFAEDSGSTKLAVAETAQPGDVPAPAEAVYKFYRFTAVDLTAEKLSRVLAEFVVPNSWINGSGVTASDVGLYRWTGTEWEAQPTEIKLNSTNNTYFYADILSFETDIFAIAAGKACPVCPSYGDWGECIDGRQEKEESVCSEETGFACQNQTLGRRCVCPGLCPDIVETDCIDGRKNVTAYSCSKETEYECVPQTDEVDCAPKLPQLLLPLWEGFTSAPPAAQVVMALAAVVVAGCAAAAGYWWFALRLHPERAERIKELIRKYMPKKRPPDAPAEQPQQPEGGEEPESQPKKTWEEDDEYGT